MPLYRDFDDPDFYAVGEVIEFVRQTLEVSMYDWLGVMKRLLQLALIFKGPSIYARQKRNTSVNS